MKTMIRELGQLSVGFPHNSAKHGKGRLHVPTLNLLQGIDIHFKKERRLDIALVKNLPIALIFLPAADIPTFVRNGKVDLGITGLDQILEHAAGIEHGHEKRSQLQTCSLEKGACKMLMELNYGACELKVQVPASGPLKSPADLIGGTVCTSFVNLTRQYFSKLECQAGSNKPNKLSTKIVELSGSVEAACALGVADGVVDLVESGETMIAAGLKDIATVAKSQAVLIKSPKSSKQGLITLIASRIRGFMRAENVYLCQCNVPPGKLECVRKITSGQQASTVIRPIEGGWQSMSTLVSKKDVALIMDKLYDAGASDILLLEVENARTGPQHALF
ncbi:hypothetical protein HYFRA_00013213 [Hymenoscyphus fraxineus]|uniref:ATP phosphoribosyltransferase n=1 Tax=Hymenoscyphus fraxineus TaxID=746836 RepID=A0A9N9L498_9HELO|nr:hypothetical protein HYFRA_00013213 [Hymenoscyphus fraxineus]